jgi:hypothetical protein
VCAHEVAVRKVKGCGRERPTLVSLYALMYEYSIDDLVLMLSALLTSSNMANFAKAPYGAISDRDFIVSITVSLDGLHKLGTAIELDSSLLQQISDLRRETESGTCDRPAIVLTERLASIIRGVHENLRSRRFMYVPRDQSLYWDNIDLFGDDFIIGFPLAALLEMIEAGNCYAAGRWTACVFHSMRVAEHGLRSLAKRLKVKLTDKRKSCPLEYGDWDKVITAIRNRIKDIRLLPRGPKKERELQFFSESADHCEYMKDIWRNEISHSRRRSTKPESAAVLNRVKEFVTPLAKPQADEAVRKRIREAKIKSLGRVVTLKELMEREGQEVFKKYGNPPLRHGTKESIS